jgi:hypothetical protein
LDLFIRDASPIFQAHNSHITTKRLIMMREATLEERQAMRHTLQFQEQAIHYSISAHRLKNRVTKAD